MEVGAAEELAVFEKRGGIEERRSEKVFRLAPDEEEVAWAEPSIVRPSTKVWSPLAEDVSGVSEEPLSGSGCAEVWSRSYCMFEGFAVVGEGLSVESLSVSSVLWAELPGELCLSGMDHGGFLASRLRQQHQRPRSVME